MTLKAHDMYQGDDWLTYRSTVAQAFDTLDRLREICLELTEVDGHPYSDRIGSAAEALSDNLMVVLSALSSLCDDLSAGLDAVLAEVYPSYKHDTRQLWVSFEMQNHLRSLRSRIRQELTSQTPSAAVLEEVLNELELIGGCLKQLDQ